MRQGMRRRLSYANVMATVAVFIALGGSSYAAIRLNGRDIKTRSIPASKIKRNALGGLEIRESTLGRVNRAKTADRVGGLTAADLKVRCPAETFPIADVCVERATRPATPYGSAVLQCLRVGTPAGPGRRLPTHGELRAALIAVPLAEGGELTGEVYPSATDPGRLDVLYVTSTIGAVGLTPDTAGGAKAYRCVTDPIN